MKLAIVGATGLVGTEMLRVVEEFKIPYTELILAASSKSVGKKIEFKGEQHVVVSISEAVERSPDIALFSAGGAPSKEWAPRFAEIDCFVIDNSSAWRMDPNVPLVVPEINASTINEETKIIANPNCSTIQMVLALAPLHKKYRIDRLVISTYQSFTGTGANAVNQYETEKSGAHLDYSQTPYAHPIFENCIPHCDVFLENDYTKEEMKMVHETRKILGDDSLRITATAVRVPVNGGHSESINIEFKSDFDINEVKQILNEMEGVTVQDDIKNNVYPMPLNARHKNDVFVGRIRRDDSIKNGLNLWVVSDNLRKGAATNAVQIAQYLLNKGI